MQQRTNPIQSNPIQAIQQASNAVTTVVRCKTERASDDANESNRIESNQQQPNDKKRHATQRNETNCGGGNGRHGSRTFCAVVPFSVFRSWMDREMEGTNSRENESSNRIESKNRAFHACHSNASPV
mmetsp:Transcript_19528/g.41074  ORF Transcript_19528/g.41074 Transcript_19528/m.41074 type:complete len:127 (+) Transcript_19528:2036-2416(+)